LIKAVEEVYHEKKLVKFIEEDVVTNPEDLNKPFIDSRTGLHCTHIFSFNIVFKKTQLPLIA
jgi:hypothetical protein